MRIWVGIVIVILLLAAFWSASHYWRTGELPDSFIQRQYAAVKQYIRPKRAYELYGQTVGNELNATAKSALANGLRDEKLYADSMARGKISNTNAARAIENAYAISNIYTHFMPPNAENTALAAQFREETLRRIAFRPAAALATTIQVERVVEEWADRDIQRAILADLHVARRGGNGTNAAPQRAPEYFTRPIAADSQNVHDSSVQADSLRIFRAMQTKNAAEFGTAQAARIRAEAEAQAYIDAMPSDRRSAAARTFSAMRLGAENTALGTTEYDLLTEAWLRTSSAENAKARDDLRSAYADALVDAGAGGSTVCISGRCNRLLGAFTLLDADSRIAEPVKTRDILRTEVLGKAHQILRQQLEASHLDALYDSGGDAPELSIVLNNVRASIANISDEYPNQKPDIMAACIQDALAGV